MIDSLIDLIISAIKVIAYFVWYFAIGIVLALLFIVITDYT